MHDFWDGTFLNFTQFSFVTPTTLENEDTADTIRSMISFGTVWVSNVFTVSAVVANGTVNTGALGVSSSNY